MIVSKILVIMRFMKGSKVEVLSKKEVATGAWLCAEIISGNGHTYSVKYGWFPMISDVVVERVPRKAIRPCPPPVEGADSWVVGDLVEVFHNLSWKTATIRRVIGGSNILVRLLGTSHEFSVYRSHLRVRQSWEDGKWFVVGKGSRNCMMPASKKQTDIKIKQDCHLSRKDIGNVEPPLISTRKRRGSYNFDAYSNTVHKMRAVEKSECSLQPGNPSAFLNKQMEFHFKESIHAFLALYLAKVRACVPCS